MRSGSCWLAPLVSHFFHLFPYCAFLHFLVSCSYASSSRLLSSILLPFLLLLSFLLLSLRLFDVLLYLPLFDVLPFAFLPLLSLLCLLSFAFLPHTSPPFLCFTFLSFPCPSYLVLPISPTYFILNSYPFPQVPLLERRRPRGENKQTSFRIVGV